MVTEATNLKESQIALDEMVSIERDGALLEAQERYSEEVSEYEEVFYPHLSDEVVEIW